MHMRDSPQAHPGMAPQLRHLLLGPVKFCHWNLNSLYRSHSLMMQTDNPSSEATSGEAEEVRSPGEDVPFQPPVTH